MMPRSSSTVFEFCDVRLSHTWAPGGRRSVRARKSHNISARAHDMNAHVCVTNYENSRQNNEVQFYQCGRMECLPNATSLIVVYVNGKEVRQSCKQFVSLRLV